MIDQIVKLHMGNREYPHFDENYLPPLTDIHIGCDEVLQIGLCPLCQKHNHNDLFLSHVRNVSDIIKRRYPELTIIIWDDMLRHIPTQEIEESNISKFVQPMIWVYTEEIKNFITPEIWQKYASIFPTVWIASAYKGAHGETLMIPPSRRHLENTLQWLALSFSEGHRFKDGIRGIALTGWQRYDHFAVLCELLPTSLPTLAICLSTASRGYFEVKQEDNPVLTALTCPEGSSNSERPWLDLINDPTLQSFSKCMFPGNGVFRYVAKMATTLQQARELIDSIKYDRGWLTEYNIKHNYSSPSRVNEFYKEASLINKEVKKLALEAYTVMLDIYDEVS